VNVFFFGDSKHPLYGVLQPPAIPSSEPKAVLLCYPFGQEYMRAHRAYRQLSLLLSKKGYYVMRFDYRGTGDSSGDLEDATFENWLDDIAAAETELRAVSGAEKVSIIGLRLGALMAVMAAKRINNVERLTLWDHITSGLSYDEELLAEIAQRGESLTSFVDEQNNLHFNGFCLHALFREQIRQVNLLGEVPKAKKTLQIVSSENAVQQALKQSWQDKVEGYQYMHTPAPGDWNYVDNFGGILLPQPVIQGIVNWFD